MSTLALLKDLLSRASVTPHDAGCQEAIAARLEKAGFAIERMGAGGVTNLWATHGNGAPLIVLAGHTDVVPPGPIEAWTSDPFAPVEREGYLVARGAADMKASVAAMTIALENIAQEGHSGTVALLLTSDEEGPGVDGTRHVLDELAGRGVKIDAALVGEPTSENTFGDTIKVGRRGSLSGHLTVTGKQGHAAYPQLADNAVHKLAPALAALVALDWGRGTEAFPPTTLQISNIRAGTGAGNVVPGHAEILFNLRFGTDWTVDAIQIRIDDLLRDHGISDNVLWQCGAQPFLTATETLLEPLVKAVETVTGLRPNPSTGGGTSDARFFAAHDIPVAEFGPINATIHAVDECVAIADIEALTKIYEQFLLALV